MIKFLESAEAKGKLNEIYKTWEEENGVKPLPVQKGTAIAEWLKVKRWARCSKTAKDLIFRVENSKKTCFVVCYRGTGRTVFGGDEPRVGEGCVHWDIDARYKSHGGNTDFHHYIAMLHEMGHFTQWSDRNQFYSGTPIMHQPTIIQQGARQHFIKMAGNNGENAYQRKKAYAKTYIGNPVLPTYKGWSIRIEMDNLIRHEWPICDEAKIPRRLGYTDLTTV